MTSVKYIGMDVHTESISIAVRNSVGKIVTVKAYRDLAYLASAALTRKKGRGVPEAANWFCWKPDYKARLPAATHRAAESALSSGLVLKAIAAPGAALRIALMTTSNNARLRGGRRTPPPMTTQS
jgi:hypothetical protein